MNELKTNLPKETEHTFVSPSVPKTIVLESEFDGGSFEVDVLTAKESLVMSSWIKHGMDCPMTLQFTSNILSKVIKFIKKHAEIWNTYEEKLAHEKLKDFNSEFLKENQRALVDLLTAACDLQIRSLLDLTCEVIVDLMNVKTSKKIYKMFHMKQDLTFEDMENVPFLYGKWFVKDLM